jgi:hypothetical protein
MRGMQARILGMFVMGLTVAACGPSLEADHVKTPDELIAEQEAAGAEQMKNQKSSADYDDTNVQTEEDKRRGWDAKQADLEMHRAAHSAESCPESITEKAPKGMATVSVTFGNDGHVKAATINEPYGEDTTIGKCVLRALKAIIVPAYQGSEETLNWEIDLKGGKTKKSGPVGGAPAEGEEKK